MKKIVRFTEYRINHVRNRRSGLSGYYGQQTGRPSSQPQTAT